MHRGIINNILKWTQLKKCPALISFLVCMSYIYKQTDTAAYVFIHTFIFKI